MAIVTCLDKNCSLYNVCTRVMEENSAACEGFKKMYSKDPEKAVKIQRASYSELADMLSEKFKMKKENK